MKKTSCPLCRAEELTTRYYEDKLIWIASCFTCQVPMGVIWRHSMQPTQEEYQQLVVKLNKIGTKIFGTNNFYFDQKQWQILTHLHYHVRKK